MTAAFGGPRSGWPGTERCRSMLAGSPRTPIVLSRYADSVSILTGVRLRPTVDQIHPRNSLTSSGLSNPVLRSGRSLGIDADRDRVVEGIKGILVGHVVAHHDRQRLRAGRADRGSRRPPSPCPSQREGESHGPSCPSRTSILGSSGETMSRSTASRWICAERAARR